MRRASRSIFLTTFSLLILGGAALWQTKGNSPENTDSLLPALKRNSPRYWKGNLHTHSLWSDGDDFPEMIGDWYKQNEYNFLALSDHNVLSVGERWIDTKKKSDTLAQAIEKYTARFGHWVERRTHDGKDEIRLKPLSEFRSLLDEPSRFLMVQGEEITHSYARWPVHLNAINLRDLINPIDGDTVAETIRLNERAVSDQRKRTGQPMLAFLNHPNFYWAIRAEDFILAESLKFFEVYNGHPSVRNYGNDIYPGCERMWDIVLALRLGKYNLPIIYGLATDDAHEYHKLDVGRSNVGRGWIMVRAQYLTPESILAAMEKGDFYGSSGVVLNDIQQVDGKFSISIEAQPGVTYKTQFIATMKDADFESSPRRDKEGKEGHITRKYSDDIGKVVHESDGVTPSYEFTGDELYVRAKIISSKVQNNPFKSGDVEVAWTQPVRP